MVRLKASEKKINKKFVDLGSFVLCLAYSSRGEAFELFGAFLAFPKRQDKMEN